MFDMPGVPAPPQKYPNWSDLIMCNDYVQLVDLDCYVQPANFPLKSPSTPPN